MEQNYGKILSAFKENFRTGSSGDHAGNIGTPGYPESVSYTHLDVYKRHVTGTAIIHLQCTAEDFLSIGFRIIKQTGTGKRKYP